MSSHPTTEVARQLLKAINLPQGMVTISVVENERHEKSITVWVRDMATMKRIPKEFCGVPVKVELRPHATPSLNKPHFAAA